MNKKHILLYCASLLCCFALGFGATMILKSLDSRPIKPLEGGQTLDFSSFGFTMRAPENAILRDHTEDNASEGGDALYAGSISTEEDGVLYVFCYENLSRDSLNAYSEQEVVTHYMSMGATDVRMREFGGRRFIAYRATILGTDGEQKWDTYETWDEKLQITFETRMNPEKALPMLATLTFSDGQ
ncbi:MAG: hypothetical protein IKK34_00505 [Clostridia bacterium]|nr:hypothetical protein [Clostridia bacterium]